LEADAEINTQYYVKDTQLEWETNIKMKITNKDQMQIIMAIINKTTTMDKGEDHKCITQDIINIRCKMHKADIWIIIMNTEINKIMDIGILEIQKIFTMGIINGQIYGK